MSIDSAAKRFSALNVSSPYRGMCLFPDGDTTARDRAALAYLYAGFDPGNHYILSAEAGTFDWTGLDATFDVTAGHSDDQKRLSAINISLPWRGLGAFPNIDPKLSRIGRANFYTGVTQTINQYHMSALTGSFSWTGYDASFDVVQRIDDANKRFSALDIGLPWRGLNVFPGVNANLSRIARANFYTGLTTSGVNHYTLTAQSGTYAWDGEPSFSDFDIGIIDSGVYTLTGYDAILIATRTLFADTGVYTWTGYDSELIKFVERTMLATSGVFSYAGSDAIFTTVRGFNPLTGYFLMTGYPATLTWANASGQDLRPPDVFSGGHPFLQPPKRKKKRRLEVTEQTPTVIKPIPIVKKRSKPEANPLVQVKTIEKAAQILKKQPDLEAELKDEGLSDEEIEAILTLAS